MREDSTPFAFPAVRIGGSVDTSPFEPVGVSAQRLVARLKQKMAVLGADGTEAVPRPALRTGRASLSFQEWKRERDSNPRPVGNEPTELTELLYPAEK
jgi:hypothetical protein